MYSSGSIPSGTEERTAAARHFPPYRAQKGAWGYEQAAAGLGDTALGRANPCARVPHTATAPLD